MQKITDDQLKAAAARLGETSVRQLARELGVGESGLRGRLQRAGYSTAGSYRSLPTTPDEDFKEIPVFFRDYSDLEKLHLYPLGDVHKGAPMHAVRRWRAWLDYLVNTPHASMLGTGDFFNAALKDSKSDVYEERLTMKQARHELRDELQPLAVAGRLDGIADGNHEDRITRATGDSPGGVLAEMLGVPHTEAAALFVYFVGDHTYEILLRHGTGNGQSPTQLEKGYNIYPMADVQLTGHTHKQIVTPLDFFVRNGAVLERRHRYNVSSGSFIALEKYAAKAGYAPTRLGAPRIRLDGRHHDVHVSV